MYQHSEEKQIHNQRYRHSQLSENKNKKHLKPKQDYSLQSLRTRSTKFKHNQNYLKSNDETSKNLRQLRAKEKETNRRKFADEYTKITSQFKNLLVRNLHTNRHLTQHAKIVQNQKNQDDEEKNDNNPTSISRSENKLKFFKARNKKLQRLYTDQSHEQILKSTNRLNAHLSQIHDKGMIVHLAQQKEKKINEKFQYIPELLQHFNNLYGIRELLEDYKNNYELIIRRIKLYILSDNGADITKLDQLLKIQKEQYNLRCFLCLEKILIIGVLDSLVRERFIEHDAKLTIDSTLEVYFSILTYIKSQNFGLQFKIKINNILEQLSHLQLQKRKDLPSTIDFIQKKVQIFYRYNQPYFLKVKSIMEESKQNKFKINRCFYDILTKYAINLNESPDIFNIHKSLLNSFATCPSPHLPFSRNKGDFTIVIQLESCLGLMRSTNKSRFIARPYAFDLLLQLQNVCEVIIFSALLPESLEDVPQILDLADSVLYRYHCIRYRGNYLKDISRLGRKLDSVIIVDTQSDNITHKQNLLQVKAWKGNPLDNQLARLTKCLKSIIQQNPNDIRESLEHQFQKKITPQLIQEQEESLGSDVVKDYNHSNLKQDFLEGENQKGKVLEQKLEAQNVKVYSSSNILKSVNSSKKVSSISIKIEDDD